MKRNTLILSIVVGIAALIYAVWASLKVAPNFAMSLLTIVIIVLMYVLSEQWVTHAANEFENRFWSAIAFLLAFVCVFLDDSPLKFGRYYPISGTVLCLFFAFFIHNYDRHIRRGKLMRVKTLKRVESSTIMNQSSENLHEMLAKLNKLQEGIDYFWFSSTFLNIFMLPTVLYIENQIISIFTEVSHHELNYIVCNGHMGLLFYKVKDHKFAKKFNRTVLLETLAIHRISELSTLSRALLIDGLQRMKLSAHPKSELYVRNIFLKTYGDDLSDLKNITDSKGDINSLHKLIYVDIRDQQVRKSILDHIRHEARVQKAHMTLSTSNTSKRRKQFAWRKILSDVDDTLSCSGGSYPAGIDTSYPRKVLYPGVLAFYRELDLGISGPDTWSSDRVGNLVFLSARPHVYQDASEKHSYDMFKILQANRGLHTSPSLLAGSLETGSKFIVAGQMEPLAQKKYENFQEYAALYEEFDFVFVGDNGQGDVRAAELVSQDQLISRNMVRAYMHEVQPLHMTHTVLETTRSRTCPYINYFQTYVDAAVDAYEHKLIRLSGLQKVAQEAVLDFDRIPWDLFGSNAAHGRDNKLASHVRNSSAAQKQHNKADVDSRRHSALQESFRKRYLRLLELNHALMAANIVIERGGLKPVQLLRFQCLYDRGTPVSTPFGGGVVERFRPFDGTYEVLLQMGLRDNCTGGHRAYLNGDSIRHLEAAKKGRKSFIRALLGRSASAYSHVHTPTLATPSVSRLRREALTKSSSSQSIGSVEGDGSFTVQWIAWTPYGLAKVVCERTSDDIVELKAPWGAKLYLSCKCVVKMKEVFSPVALDVGHAHLSKAPVDREVSTPARARGYSFTSPFASMLSPDRKGDQGELVALRSSSQPPPPPTRSSFWLRIFGYGSTGPATLCHPTAVDAKCGADGHALGLDATGLKCVYSATGVVHMEIVEKFLEEFEAMLTGEIGKYYADASSSSTITATLDPCPSSIATAGEKSSQLPCDGNIAIPEHHVELADSLHVDSRCIERFVVHTSYGSGRLLELIDRGESVLLRVQLNWGAYGVLSINTLQSFELLFGRAEEVSPVTSTFSRDRSFSRETPSAATHSVSRLSDYLEKVRRLRSRILLTRSRTTSVEEEEAIPCARGTGNVLELAASCGSDQSVGAAEGAAFVAINDEEIVPPALPGPELRCCCTPPVSSAVESLSNLTERSSIATTHQVTFPLPTHEELVNGVVGEPDAQPTLQS